MRRRTFLGGVAAALVVSRLGATTPLRVGMTTAFLNNRHGPLQEWQDYLQQRLGGNVVFVPRKRDRELMNMLEQRKLEFAWVCSYPYVALGDTVRLLAVPESQGTPSYRSYLIVPVADGRTRSFMDLRGSVFAYTDLYSNSGYLTPRHTLVELGEDPDRFFQRTFYTWSHRAAIEAVAVRLADGAAVSSFVWESLARLHPELVAGTRVVWRSREYGFPPFVAHSSVGPAEFRAVREVLLGMAADADGRAILTTLNLDRFGDGEKSNYDAVAAMARHVSERS
jgi:phosphonate transport system substrate-binding protein